MKNEISTMTVLAEKIKALKETEAIQLMRIKSQTHDLLADLKPSALIKSAFNQIAGSKDLQHNVIDTSAGVGAGILARKLFTFNSKNILRKMAGYALQFVATSLVSKKMPALREKIAGR